MSYVLDAYDDKHNEVLSSIVGKTPTHERGEMVKYANGISLLTEDELRRLTDHQFGIRIMTKLGSCQRKYPISSPEQVWLSAKYFESQGGLMPKLAQAICAYNIKKAADVFHVPIHEGFDTIADTYTFHDNVYVEGMDFAEKTAGLRSEEDIARSMRMEDDRFWALTDGQQRAYWIGDSQHVKLAAAKFEQEGTNLPPRQRQEFASRVTARAIDFGMPEVANTPMLRKYAGVGFGDHFLPQMKKRAELAVGKGLHPRHYQNLYDQHTHLGPAKTAGVLMGLDKQYGLSQYWDRSLLDPYATAYGNHQIKVAEDSATVAGQTYMVSDLRKIPKAAFEKTFGATAWRGFEKDPMTILRSMPREEQEIIVNMIP